MSADNSNEPAFPIYGALDDHQYCGLSMRDYFAVRVLASLLTSPEPIVRNSSNEKQAEWSYEMADALLKARIK